MELKEATPAEARIKEAAAGKEHDENARNCDEDILDQDEAPVVFSGGKPTRI